MTEEEMETARAFVRCSPWKWLPGMLCIKPVGIPGGPHGGMGYQPSASVRVTKVTLYPARLSMGAYDWSPVGCLPDITDPATLGCILQMVEDAWGLPVGMWYPRAGRCAIALRGTPVLAGRIFTAATKPKALLRALQAAPNNQTNKEHP